jgi:hypothetical protein
MWIETKSQLPFINEIHYDNVGDDANEGVEIAVSANDNKVYVLRLVFECIFDGDYRSDDTSVATISAPINGIKYIVFRVPMYNGMTTIYLREPRSPRPTIVLEELAYEGITFISSTDIGFSEDDTVPSTFSLQRRIGCAVWDEPRASTFGAANVGTSACPTAAPVAIATAAPVTVPTAAPVTIATAAPVAIPTAAPVTIATAAPVAYPTAAPITIATAVPVAIPNATPTKMPTQAPINCGVVYQLFNSKTEQFVANLLNGTTLTTPPLPPCKLTNIEAILPCGSTDNRVVIELFSGSKRIRRQVESTAPYFLFGNRGTNVVNGKIAPGTYRIRTQVNNVFTPFTTFTLQGPRCS